MPATARPEPSDLTKEIAAIINGLLARRGKEQQQLAAAVGVSRAQISRMLSGQKHWDIDQLTLACAFLDADPMEVILDAQHTVAQRANVAPLTEDEIDIVEPRQSDHALAAKRRRKKIHDTPFAE